MLITRRRVHEVLEVAGPDDRASRIADIVIITLIVLNILAVILESVAPLRTAFGRLFTGFEIASVAVFSVEYLLRVWSCTAAEGSGAPWTRRLRYMLSPAALIDLVAILPFYLSFFVSIDLRFMRVLRLLRVFKLSRYSRSLEVLLSVLREEADSFGAAFFILMVVLVVASSGIYLCEYRAQPDAFASIPAAMWWAVATLTTVGYGDITPVTAGGKLFGVCIMITGIGMVALPAGILASAFSEQLRRSRASYRRMVDSVLDDGVVTDAERETLETLRRALGISAEEAEAMLAAEKRQLAGRHGRCPHCAVLEAELSALKGASEARSEPFSLA